MINRTRLNRLLVLPTISALAALGLSACQAEEETTPDPAATQAVATPTATAGSDDDGHEAAEMHDAMSDDDRRMGADGQMNGMPHDNMPMGSDAGSNAGDKQTAPNPPPSSMGEDDM